MRFSRTFEIKDKNFKQRLLAWATKHETCCILNSNRDKQLFNDQYSKFDFIVAVDSVAEIQNSGIENSYDLLKDFYDSQNDWLFGFLTYDLKNETEDLKSENQDGLEFPKVHYFQPKLILNFNSEDLTLEILYLDHFYSDLTIQNVIDEISITEVMESDEPEIPVQQTISKEEYITTVNKIKQHIQLGDIYELNYCVEHFAEEIEIIPLEIYNRLNETSPMPFSCFYRMNEHYLLCASPERFLAKREKK